jgi:hypothetical protein
MDGSRALGGGVGASASGDGVRSVTVSALARWVPVASASGDPEPSLLAVGLA